ncbi:MAG TPA: carbonic anhydrase [Pyrinomonadaceae bacterium]
MREFDEEEDDEQIQQDLQLAELAKRGATMEEIAQLREPVARTPEQAIRALKIGNARFYGGRPLRQGYSPVERRSQIIGQTPFAVVLGCSDSRVPTEYVFDQGPGQIFTVRVAGSIISPSTAGSIEYAVKHLKPHALVVMGHEGCGAVHAAMTLTEEQARAEPENVRHLLECIAPAVRNLPPIRDAKARMREAVIASVRRQVQLLKQNETVSDALSRDQIAVIGAYYEISSGAVDFLESDEDLRVDE